ncbi:hypothetical protein YC2023_030428 [Brassica napus]
MAHLSESASLRPVTQVLNLTLRDTESDELDENDKKPKKEGCVLLTPDPLPPSDALVKFFGDGESSLSRLVQRLWEYIKQNELQGTAHAPHVPPAQTTSQNASPLHQNTLPAIAPQTARMTTRGQLGIVKPRKIFTLLTPSVSRIPTTHQKALLDPYWNPAMNEEYDAQIKNRTWSHNNDLAYLLLYVDDIILTGSSKSLLHRITNSLKNEFPMSDMGRLKYFLRIKVEYNAARILLSQKNYASEIIQRAEMSNCKPILTPADLNSKLSSEAGARISNPKHYRSLARARQDISYAVQQLCLFMHDPREQHYTALKRIIRYIQGTLSYGLQIYKTKIDSLTAYYDADWARCPDTRRQPGFLVFQTTTNCLQIQRRSRKQGITKHVELDLHFVKEKVALGQVKVLHVPTAFQCADIFAKGLPSSLFNSFRSSLTVHSNGDQTEEG